MWWFNFAHLILYWILPSLRLHIKWWEDCKHWEEDERERDRETGWIYFSNNSGRLVNFEGSNVRNRKETDIFIYDLQLNSIYGLFYFSFSSFIILFENSRTEIGMWWDLLGKLKRNILWLPLPYIAIEFYQIFLTSRHLAW